TIDHSRHVALQGILEDWTEFRSLRYAIAGGPKALRIAHEIRIAEIHRRGSAETDLLLPANDAVYIVPPDKDDERELQPDRRLQLLGVHHESSVARDGNDATLRIQELRRYRARHGNP